jgi:molybdate transport system substrate-binding protein
MMGSLAAAARLATMVLVVQAGAALAAEVRVMSTPTLKTTLDELGPQFERATGHKLAIKYGSSAVLKRQIDSGETFDLALLVPASLDDLIKQGKVVTDTRADISRSLVGVAVRTGAPKPDLSSAEAFKRTLLAAKSISYSGEGASGAYLNGLIERFGIAADVKPKLRPLAGGAVVEPVAKGEIEIAVITIANIIGVPGAEVAGVLPPELQDYTVYTAGVAAGAKEPDAAKALIKFLLAPEATPVIKAKGMERLP